MCAQRLLCRQAIEEKRLSLGVLCGLKHIYQQQGLPPCVRGETITWSKPSEVEIEIGELAAA